MYPKISLLFALSIYVFLVGCAATGPADDGWETSEGFKEGGGLLSQQEGAYTFSIGQDDTGQAEASAQTPYQTPDQEKTSQEYETYLKWREAKGTNSDEYQRFKKWQEFEDFQRWKQTQ